MRWRLFVVVAVRTSAGVSLGWRRAWTHTYIYMVYCCGMVLLTDALALSVTGDDTEK